MAGIVSEKIRKWWNDYFSWSALFVSGLFFGGAFVEYSFLGFLIILIEEKLENYDLWLNAIISNAQDFSAALLAGVLLYAIEERISPFYMTLITYAGFLAGTIILLLIPTMSIGMIFLALAPLIVGQAGQGFIYLFLLNHLRLEKQDMNKEVEDIIFVWRFIARFLGATVANLWISNLAWKPTFMYSAIVTGIAYVFFLAGFKYYKRLNQSSSCQRAHSQPWRWKNLCCYKINRKMRESSSIQAESQNKEKKQESRLFLRKLPLWTPFLIYYVVEAVGSTFFMEQTDKLDDHIGKFQVPRPGSSLLVVKKCTMFIVSILADVLIAKCCSNDNQEKRARLVRMCSGFCACFGCCMVAWHFETHRLDLIHKHQDRDIIPMSISLLVPQFSLLGIADGLLRDGMTDFFYDYAPAPISHFEMAFNKFVEAVGKLIGIGFILLCHNWIRDSITTSHLDYYYRTLALLTFCASLVFLPLSNSYDWEIEEKEDNRQLNEIERQVGLFVDQTMSADLRSSEE